MTSHRLAELGIRPRQPDRAGEHRAPCPACGRGPQDDTLSIRIEHEGGAVWCCHRCGWKGGIGAARSERHFKSTPACRKLQPQPEQYNTLAERAVRLWAACRPINPRTPAAAYLKHRCCIVPPGDLRWHPDLLDRKSGYQGPALVGLVTDVETGEPINLHRTWLARYGAGKAPIDKPRRLLKGHCSNGVVRLWPDSDAMQGIVIGEGVETCLAAALEGLTPVWATMSASNLAAFPILPGIEGITVLVDHDKPNPKTGKQAGHQAALELIRRYSEAGFNPKRDIKVIMSPTKGEDINDLVRKRRAA